MDTLSELLIDFIGSENNPIGLVIIAASAMIEYVVPPFPGDTVTLFAAVLITAYGWNFFSVFGAVMAGSLAGSMAAFYLGIWLRKRRDRNAAPAERPVLEQLMARFRKHGPAYLMINRFLPGIRALFFVAAGMESMRPVSVLFYSAVSAAVWNLGIIALGSALGANFDTLLHWIRHYTTITWTIIGAVIVFMIVRYGIRRRSR